MIPTRRCGSSPSSTTTISRVFKLRMRQTTQTASPSLWLFSTTSAALRACITARTGLQRPDRSLRPRRHVRGLVQGRSGGRGQLQPDSSIVPARCPPEQFPAALSRPVTGHTRQPMEAIPAAPASSPMPALGPQEVSSSSTPPLPQTLPSRNTIYAPGKAW